MFEKLAKELESFGEGLKGEGVDFVLCIAKYEKGKQAQFSCKINTHSDHHLLDIQKKILDGWNQANHQN